MPTLAVSLTPDHRGRTRASLRSERIRFHPAILLGAFAGLRTAEAVGLRQEHVDFLRLYVIRSNSPTGAVTARRS